MSNRDWTGKNKQYCRQIKEALAIKYLIADSSSQVLSLPGSLAITEKKLVKLGVKANRLTLIDRNPQILKQVSKYSELKEADYCSDELAKVVQYTNKSNFSLIDMDICGTFHQKYLNLVKTILNRDLLGALGILAINLQKGREIRKSQALLENYYNSNIGSLFRWGYDHLIHHRIPELEAARITTIPVIFSGLGFYKHELLLEKLIEYRDIPENQKNAVNMLQYIFRFKRVPKQTIKNEFSVRQNVRERIYQVAQEYVDSCSCGGNTFTGEIYQKRLEGEQK